MDVFNLACSFCVVYLIMLIQGVGTLLPWNMFITAHAVSTQYFIVHVFVTTYYAILLAKHLFICIVLSKLQSIKCSRTQSASKISKVNII